MAILVKTANASWANYSPDGSPTGAANISSADDGYITSAAGSGSLAFSTTSAPTNARTLTIDPSAAATIDVNQINGHYTQVNLTTSGATVFSVAANKNFTLRASAGAGGFLRLMSAVTGNVKVIDIGTGSRANLPLDSNTAGATLVRKTGEGTLWTCDNAYSTVVAYDGYGFDIAAGKVVIGTAPLDPANSLGVNRLIFSGSTAVLEITGPQRTFNFSDRIYMNAPATILISGSIAYTTPALGFSGSSTLTVSSNVSPGTLVITAPVTVPLNITTNAVVNIASANNFTGSTLSGVGTLAMTGGQLGVGPDINASGHSGPITGTCSIQGGTSPFNSVFTGTIANILGGNITFTNTSTGSITNIGYATVNLMGSFTGGAAATTTLGGSGGAGGNPAILNISGVSAGLPGRILAMASNAKITLANEAAAGNTITANTDISTVTLEVPDATTATYSGTFSTNQASGNVKVQAKASGTFILSNATAMTSSNAGRTFALNADAGYTGTLKVTGAGFSGAAATLSGGTLHLAGSTNKNIGTTLTVASGATVAYGPDAPVTLTGSLSLAANSNFRFGAPA